MKSIYRKIYFLTFTCFFLILAPFLAIYSLGYNFDLDNRGLDNSITITVDSKPRSSQTYSGESLLMRSSGELRAGGGLLIPLSIRKEGYHSENFVVWSDVNTNTTARLTDLWLLPYQSEPIDRRSELDVVQIVAKDQAVIRDDGRYYMQFFNIGGLTGAKEEIKLEGVSIERINTPIRWEMVFKNTFWSEEDKLLLFKYDNSWILEDLNNSKADTASLARLNDREFLILDTQNQLWLWNYQNRNIRFIESNIHGMSYTEIPQFIWLLSYNKVYRLNLFQISETMELENFLFTQFNQRRGDVFDTSSKDFVVKNVHQGILFKVNSFVVYVPDFDKSSMHILSNDVVKVNTIDDSVLWIDSKKQLWFYNVRLKHLENLLTIGELSIQDIEKSTLFYYSLWNRVVIYAPNKVVGVWYHKDILNQNVIGYSAINWIYGDFCYQQIHDRHQMCINNNRIVTYKNTSFW